jgi:pseudolysin
MNGVIYQNLAADLQGVAASYFTDAQKNQSQIVAIDAIQKDAGKINVSHLSTELIVYIDDKNKAHWAYKIIMNAESRNHLSKPSYIIDALTHTIYLSWDNLPRLERENTLGSGYGGNSKMGRITFDGVNGNPGPLTITRDPATQTCFLQDDMVTVRNDRTRAISSYQCPTKDSQHGNTYWNGLDYSNDEDVGAYAPENDLFYNTHILINMFNDWYKLPLIKNSDNKALHIIIHAHPELDLPFWDFENQELVMGNGVTPDYLSFTTFDVLAHELGHAIVAQYSNLRYPEQSAALNESFSDMFAIAAGYYATGTTNWMIGHDLTLGSDALRYLDDPHKDCNGMPPIIERDGKKTRICSASHMSELADPSVKIDVHYSNGVFNKAFYLIAQGYGGDKNDGIHKAFNLMMQANMHYWTSQTSFAEAACGVMKASSDYAYDQTVVQKAFAEVGIDVSKC